MKICFKAIHFSNAVSNYSERSESRQKTLSLVFYYISTNNTV